MERDQALADYVEGLYEEHPDIKPYDTDDWDFTWADEGYQFLEGCDFGMAELTFQRLIAARPDDPEGFEGLATVYQALGIRDWAMLLIDEAVRLAELRIAAGLLDAEVLAEITEAQERIYEMQVAQQRDLSSPEVEEE
jgi:tetratricopeptide (TPR) repeat protein